MTIRVLKAWVRAFLLAIFSLTALPIVHAADLPTKQATLREMREQRLKSAEDYDGLLRLRNQVEVIRNDLREIVRATEEEVLAVQRNLQALPPPATAAPGAIEAPSDAAERARLQAALATLQQDRNARRAVLADAEALWNDITDRRRELFKTRLFMFVASPLTPGYWQDLLNVGVPRFMRRSGNFISEQITHTRQQGGTPLLLGLLAAMVGMVILFIWLHRRVAPGLADSGTDVVHQRDAVMRHAFFVLIMRVLPVSAVFGVFVLAVNRLDLLTPNADALLREVWVAVLVFGLSRGVLGALLEPKRPQWRLVQCSDENARTLYRGLISATNVYIVAILFIGWQLAIDAPVSITTFTAVIVGLLIPSIALVSITRLRKNSAAAETVTSGILTIRVGWLLPLVSLASAIAIASVLTGYISLGGFIAGRLTMTATMVAGIFLCALLVEDLIGHGMTSQTRIGQAIMRSVGMTAGVVDLIVTSVAGILRLLLALLGLIILFAPWGIRFGDVNPFDDTFFGFGVSDLRLSLGTVGFALAAFVVGLFGTRLTVSWLDTRLLPLTNLDQGVRNSVTTIVGYIGIALTIAIALAQLGVNPQNLAVVAGALSVGIGFGLQSIVSNFVSGLIVLAERPIRVGDQVVVKGEEGKVKKISVRSTVIGSGDRSDLIIPNTDLITSIVRNRTLFDKKQRLKLVVTVDHDADPVKVRDILYTCAFHHRRVLKESEPSVLFTKIGETGQEFELKAVVDDLGETDNVKSDLHFQITELFRKAGIKIAKA